MKFSFRKFSVFVVAGLVVGSSFVPKFSAFAAAVAEPSVKVSTESTAATADFVSMLEAAGLNSVDPNNFDDVNNRLVHGGFINTLKQVKDQSVFKKFCEEKGFSNQDAVDEEMKNSGFLKAIMKFDLSNSDLVWAVLCDDENNEQLKKLLDDKGQLRQNLKANLVNVADGEIILTNDLMVSRDRGEGFSDVSIIFPGFLAKGKLPNDSKLRLNIVDKTNNTTVETFEINAQLKPIKKEEKVN